MGMQFDPHGASLEPSAADGGTVRGQPAAAAASSICRSCRVMRPQPGARLSGRDREACCSELRARITLPLGLHVDRLRVLMLRTSSWESPLKEARLGSLSDSWQLGRRCRRRAVYPRP